VKNESAIYSVFLRQGRSYFTLLPIHVATAGLQEDRRKRPAAGSDRTKNTVAPKPVVQHLANPPDVTMDDIETREIDSVYPLTPTPPDSPSSSPEVLNGGNRKDPFVAIMPVVSNEVVVLDEVEVPQTQEMPPYYEDEDGEDVGGGSPEKVARESEQPLQQQQQPLPPPPPPPPASPEDVGDEDEDDVQEDDGEAEGDAVPSSQIV
jgi:hypothetical protein